MRTNGAHRRAGRELFRAVSVAPRAARGRSAAATPILWRVNREQLVAGLRRHFGHAEFRPGQEPAVAAAVAGRDVLLVMPTGAGKSLCYQLPALLDEQALTVVVSPLVSLMQDQVERLGERAELVNSQRTPAQNAASLERALSGEARLLYVAPERFWTPGFGERLKGRVGLFVVDEAHCVSQWGHDFRPEYFRLGEVARRLGARSIFAATATATPRVAVDIVRRLGLRSPVRITTGFERPNLSYDVVTVRDERARRRALGALLREPGALPAIVYSGTRKRTEETAARLERELGLPVRPYHAGMEREERAEAQSAFMAGELPVVVATNAFGMGVDKADVRTVVHEAVPSSLEAYYQEAGRAGRDGRPARCVLLASGQDKGLHVHFIQSSESDEGRRVGWANFRAVWGWVEGEGCRREGLLRHFGDRGEPRAEGRCCDRCDGPLEVAELVAAEAQAVPAGAGEDQSGRRSARRAVPVEPGYAEREAAREAIIEVVRAATPAVGRTRAVEILRGGRSKVVRKYGYDELPGYGSLADWRAEELLGEVDALLEAGVLRSTGGRFPKLALAGTNGDGGGPRDVGSGDSGSDAPEPAVQSRASAGGRGAGLRVAVLASGTGTNLQAILDRVHGRDGIEVVAVASDKPNALALERARRAGVETAVFRAADYPDREARDEALGDWLEERGVELLVLAGYMQILSPPFVRRFERRTINVHPALLPSFPGLDAIGQALQHGVRVTGVTVHFVDEGVDTGPILLQRAVPVPEDRDRDRLEEAIHAVEHELLPQAIRLIAAGRVSFDPDNPRVVRIAPEE